MIHFPSRTESDEILSVGEMVSRYEQIFNALFEGIYIVDWTGSIVYVNRAMEAATGFTRAELYGHRCCENMFSRFNEFGAGFCPDSCPVHQALGKRDDIDMKIWLIHKTGKQLPFQIRVIPIRDLNDTVQWAAVILRNRLPDLQADHWKDAFRRKALLDHLTEIPNRRHLEINLENRLRERERYGWSLGVLFADIDHFKSINDRFGHHRGDALLKAVASLMQERQRPFDLLGRWGGEEFVIIVLNVTRRDLEMVAERLRHAVETMEFSHDGRPIPVTISIGGVIAGQNDTVESIIRRADEMMYRSKANGRNRVTIGEIVPEAG